MYPSIALTVDLEDWYHGICVSPHRDQVEADTGWLLQLFDEAGVRATFFAVGQVAERHPDLIRHIAKLGHEIGFHGYSHAFLHELGRERFADELAEWLPRLERLSGHPVAGYRAPFFSITPQTDWALDVLCRSQLQYDASIYPAYNDRYGWWGAPRTPVRLHHSRLVLFPVPLLHPCIPIAFSGGAYLRMLPWPIITWGLRSQRSHGQPGMVYTHPWEVAQDLPPSCAATMRARLTRYPGRRGMRKRLMRILGTWRNCCGPMKEVVAALPDPPEWNPAMARQRHWGRG